MKKSNIEEKDIENIIEETTDEVITETNEDTNDASNIDENEVDNDDIIEEDISAEDLEKELEFGESEKTSLHDYVKLSDKYSDILSSSYTMLLVGLLGAAFLICLITDIIPIDLGATALLFHIVMGLVFGSFIIAGLISLRSALKIKDAAHEEELLIKEISSWADENIQLEIIDQNLDLDDSIEELYFLRFARIKDLLMHEFEGADEPLIEELSEQVYQNMYESDESNEVEDVELTSETEVIKESEETE